LCGFKPTSSVDFLTLTNHFVGEVIEFIITQTV
jgi:hypothetical protein